MGITGMMRTSVSGMNAQSNRLSGVADNVANASTAGYKRADTQFSTLVIPSGRSSYESGGVNSHIRYDISRQGIARVTGRAGDVMINGGGFFRVMNNSQGTGDEFLTRAGSFEVDKEGYFRNAAGFYLLNKAGQPIRIDIGNSGLSAPEATAKIDMAANLSASASVITAGEIDPEKPETYSQKKSVTVYDSQGAAADLDIFYAKTADNTWKMMVYRDGEAVKGGAAELKFDKDGNLVTISKLSPSIVTMEVKFDKDGNLVTPSAGEEIILALQGPDNSEFNIRLNLFDEGGKSLMTQQGSDYLFKIEADGVPSGVYSGFSFSPEGQVMVSYSNGKVVAQDFVGLATVTSPDRLTVISGTVFQKNGETGAYITNGDKIVEGATGGQNVFGTLQSGVLEESNADIGNELTDMIEAQRNYTANSKVFQTGSEVMDVIINLKR